MSPTSESVGESRYLIGNERSTAFENGMHSMSCQNEEALWQADMSEESFA
jgi:hypothetical protein